MKKVILVVVLITLVAGVSLWALRKEREITNFPPKDGPIVAFGDSLIEGVGATAGVDLPALLSEKIGEPIINMGASGETSAEGLARVDKVTAQNPSVVLVLFGGNDLLRKISKNQTFENLDKIILRLQESGAVVILLGIRGGLLSDNYEGNFENLAKERGALYVPDVLNGIFGHPKFMSDGIHPNNEGYVKIADKIYPVLKRALDK